MRRGGLVVLFVFALRGAACTTERPTCYGGEYSACTCANGAVGYAVCDPQIADYRPCVCDGTTPGLDASASAAPDASADASGDASPSGTKRALFEPCETDAQCESGRCFTYGQGAMLCSKSCAVDADCPSPSPGCNGKKVCKAP